MIMGKIKQVIVMRERFPSKHEGVSMGMNKGKMIAQGAHAACAFLCERIREGLASPPMKDPPHNVELLDFLRLYKPEIDWVQDLFTKVVLSVETEEELLDTLRRAEEAGLEVHLITDAGLTEFGGVPTNTCIGIGPDYEEKIDKITGPDVLTCNGKKYKLI